MRGTLALLLTFCLTIPPTSASGQTNPLAQFLLQASQAFSANGAVSSIVLTGQVNRYAGSDNENGTITLTARADGSSTVQLQVSSGEVTESQDAFANGRACSWSGPDGVAHGGAGHNCIVPVAWFLPEVALFSGALPANGTFSLLPNSSATTLPLHWSMLVPSSAPEEQALLLSHIGAYDLNFDGSSFLPASLTYNLHPDANAGIDIPVAIRYSNYQTVNGVSIPFHIERYLNGVLSLDVTLSTAVVTH